MNISISDFIKHLDEIGVTDIEEQMKLVKFSYSEEEIDDYNYHCNIFYHYPRQRQRINDIIDNSIFAIDLINILNTVYERLNTEEVMEDVKVPLNETILKQLKHAKYNPTEHDKCSTCSICQVDFEKNTSITLLDCNHYFHDECIIPWFKSYHHICPVCRTDYN